MDLVELFFDGRFLLRALTAARLLPSASAGETVRLSKEALKAANTH